MAAIAAAPSNLLIMLLSFPISTDPASLPDSVKRIDRRLTQSCGMNFARCKCDRRGVQSLMRKVAFALQIRNETQHIGTVAGHGQSGDFNKIK
jgi:hypothetical protein